MSLPSLWKSLDICSTANMKSINSCSKILLEIHQFKRQKLFIWDARPKLVMKELRQEKEHNKIRYLWNIWLRFMKNTRNGSTNMIRRNSWWLTLIKILKMTKKGSKKWYKSCKDFSIQNQTQKTAKKSEENKMRWFFNFLIF
jgi:hypothetical protein